ncbi:MAG: hypothetical protein AAF851_11625 [Myxococcota bacterium]
MMHAWAAATGIAADFPNAVVTRGDALEVSLRVDDPIDVVRQVRFTLRTGGVQWTQTATSSETGRFRTVFEAKLWSLFEGPPLVEAEALGRRGGLILFVGPLELEVLSPADAATRRAALAQAQGGPSRVGASIGVLGRIGTGSRARLFARFHLRLSRSWELGMSTHVGPAFAEPRFADGGPVTLGFELDARRVLGRWGPAEASGHVLAGVDLRLPGADPMAGGGIGLTWGRDIAFDARLDGAFALFDGTEAGFVSSLRLGIRFEEGL